MNNCLHHQDALFNPELDLPNNLSRTFCKKSYEASKLNDFQKCHAKIIKKKTLVNGKQKRLLASLEASIILGFASHRRNNFDKIRSCEVETEKKFTCGAPKMVKAHR